MMEGDGPMAEGISEAERVRRQQYTRDSRAAVQLGIPLDTYLAKRDENLQDYTEWMRHEMDRIGVDDPAALLPHFAVKIEEKAVAAARTADKETAENVLKTLLRKMLGALG